jgi:tripartite-type tricarboxylate transporter receptor subunit TctC
MIRVAAFLLLTLLGTALHAQQFPVPGKPVRIVVPFPAGGQTDIQARALAAKLSQSLGVSVVVENKPGASTIIGATDIIRSAPDGHSLLYTISSTAAQNPHLFSKLPYDPFRDLTAVMFAARSATILVAPANAPFNNVKELIAFAKANPGKVFYGSFSLGSTSHLAGEVLARSAGIDIVHVPYKGSGDAMVGLLSGAVQLLFDGPTTAINNARAGKVKMLAIGDDRRYSVAPEVPTMAEAGVPGFDKLAGGMQFFGPANMPRPVLAQVNAELAKALRQPDITKLFVEGGTEVLASSPEEHARSVRELYDSFGVLIRGLGIKLD